MLSFEQGVCIARETNTSYEDPIYVGEPYVFHEGRMDSQSCWIDHVFYLADQVEHWLIEKRERFDPYIPEEIEYADKFSPAEYGDAFPTPWNDR